MKECIKTSYGEKKISFRSPLVFVAPHAGGDDILTDELTKYLANRLQASCFLNTRFTKPKEKETKRLQEDFNQLVWFSEKGKYLWGNPREEVRHFYSDIDLWSEYLLSKNIQPVFIHIHGMQHDSIAVDIGAGYQEENCQKLEPRQSHGSLEDPRNTGVATCDKKLVEMFKRSLSEELEKRDLMSQVTVGCIYTALSRQSGNQYNNHHFPNSPALQLEINKKLRKVDTLEVLTYSIAASVSKIFTS